LYDGSSLSDVSFLYFYKLIYFAKNRKTKMRVFTNKLKWELKRRITRCLFWSVLLYEAETRHGHWRKWIFDGWRLVKCGYGEEWKELVGWTKFKMKKCWQKWRRVDR